MPPCLNQRCNLASKGNKILLSLAPILMQIILAHIKKLLWMLMKEYVFVS